MLSCLVIYQGDFKSYCAILTLGIHFLVDLFPLIMDSNSAVIIAFLFPCFMCHFLVLELIDQIHILDTEGLCRGVSLKRYKFCLLLKRLPALASFVSYFQSESGNMNLAYLSKAPFIWSWVTDTALPRVILGEITFPCVVVEFSNRLYECPISCLRGRDNSGGRVVAPRQVG